MARPTFDAPARESFYAGGPMERFPTRVPPASGVRGNERFRDAA
jgi:hypothetical protein